MKLAFSTLGCPGWSFDEIFATAKDLGIDGIEIRGIANEMVAPNIKVFNEPVLSKTMQKLNNSKVSIPILTSGACIGGEQEKSVALKEITEYIDLAEKLSAKFVRVLISSKPEKEPCDLAAATEIYQQACEYGKAKGVTPLLETNGFFCDSSALKVFMSHIISENKGVLWDVHHPYRFNGEQPAETVANLGSLIQYVHVKDSVVRNGKLCYRMMGYGDVPVLDALICLKNSGYDSFVSLEWVKRWCPDLQEAGIVFSHYLSYMNCLFNQL